MLSFRPLSNTPRMLSPPFLPRSSSVSYARSNSRHSVSTMCNISPRLAIAGPPSERSSACRAWMPSSTKFWMCGIWSRMVFSKNVLSFFDSAGVPTLCSPRYAGCDVKNSISARRAEARFFLPSMSACDLLTIPIHPCLSVALRFVRMRCASVPRSMMSSFVSTPIVLSPAGSTSFASLSASLVAASALAGVTASMIAFLP
mmetsp:Transcript_7687/g.19860  ORF Transcript_7687/g.19860 Transcript_7687/m.19860 type:complete len:201 (+) Transcript_7687:1074-1676(+)